MADDSFDLIEQAVASDGAAPALDLLALKFLTEKQYPQLFETRLMQKRLELGLPLIQLGAIEDLPEPKRSSYEEGVRQAAREAGTLFLAGGDIPHAWPYFRAIGDRETIASAIEATKQPNEQMDALIDIALGERVHPRKGLELVIAQHGICRAITYFEQFPDLENREECLKLLVRTLHAELIVNLKSAIERQEGVTPPDDSLPELMAGRDWLFGEFDAYVDTSHVIDVIRFALDLRDRGAIRLALELCEYGAHLSPQFRMRGDAPFDDIYRDHAIYLHALLGEDLQPAIEYFKTKIVAQDDPMAAARSAQVLVGLLLRHERYREAVQVSLEHLSGIPANQLACPSLYQLCQLAGDSARLKALARERGDLLGFAAGAITSGVNHK
ncbi:MAG: hypothetical protein ABSG13_06395 [Bryobacteraceae bacterium]